MAQVSTNAPAHVNFGGAVANFFKSIVTGMMKITEANHLVQKADYLNSLSDAELAQRGLKREDIARHVFASYMGV